MTQIILPRLNFSLIAGKTELSTAPIKALFIGQKLASGSATSGSLVENIGVAKQEDALFGEDSMIAAMIRVARKVNKNTRFDAIPLDDDGDAAKALSPITFAGVATSAGTITTTVGSKLNHTFSLPVAIGDTSTEVAAAIDPIIDADPQVPVVATNLAGTLTLTAKNGGTVGNDIGLEVSGDVAGITFTVPAMAGGATDPVLTNLFDVVGTERYQTIIWPQNYDLTVIKTFLDGRINVNKRILDGVAIIGKFDTFANINALVLAENTRTLVFVGNEIIADPFEKAGSILELPYVMGAHHAALRTLRLTPGANIANIVTSTSPRDRIGGVRLNSLPYFNTPFQFLPIMKIGKGFDDFEVATLTASGFSVLGNNTGRTSIIMGEMVTTSKTDAASNPDITFKFLNFGDTSSASREILFVNNQLRFSQSRLTSGTPGDGLENADTIRAFNNSLFRIMGNSDNLLVPAGSEAEAFFDLNMIISINDATGTANITQKLPILTQLREMNNVIEVVFTIGIVTIEEETEEEEV